MRRPRQPAVLLLDDGTVYQGLAFGADVRATGELVFNTSMTGYQEILTDPSYAGQIVTLTMPHIGNYGVSRAASESTRIQAAGVVVRALSDRPSNWRSEQSFEDWLISCGVAGITDVDTRAVTRHIRDKGVMQAMIVSGATAADVLALRAELEQAPRYDDVDWVARVRCAAPSVCVLQDDGSVRFVEAAPDQRADVVVVDFGVKHSILHNLVSRGLDVILVPSHAGAEQVLAHRPRAVLVSNGPGDPAILNDVLPQLRQLADSVPTWGICLGHQLLARAYGAETFKLPFGHRGPNQPVQDIGTGRVLITSQNHGYAVLADSLPAELEVTQLNLNDGTVEAFRHRDKPVYAVQYHPEAGPGPHDAESFFDEFADVARDRD